MTENEIILEKQIADDLSAVLKEAKAMGCREVACFRHIPLQNVEAVIQALEEIQQYRAIGALEEIKKVISFLSNDNDNSVIDDMNVLNAYRSIGTIEELQALKEKAVLIMDMPASCGKCQLKLVGEYLDVRCAIGHRVIPITYGRPEWCPLKQISTGRTKA